MVLPLIIAGLTGAFAGAQLDDAIEEIPEDASVSSETPVTINEKPVFTFNNGLKFAMFAGASWIAIKAYKDFKG